MNINSKPISRPNQQTINSTQRQAEKLLQAGKLKQAEELLTSDDVLEASPKSQALLGAALFRQEKYEQAADAYQAAAASSEDPIYEGLAEQARQNAATDISYDHAVNPFTDMATVQGKPSPESVSPAVAEPIKVERNIVHRAVRAGLNVTGKVLGGITGAVLGWAARKFGQEDKGEVWTQWSHKNWAEGMLMLKNHRDRLNEKNLHDTYPEGQLTGFAKPGMKQPEWTKHNRTMDGSWNNAANPLEGAAGTRFGRMVSRDKTLMNEKMLMVPNPRLISRLLQTRKDGMKEVPFLNMNAVWWIQMETHDWVSHGDNRNGEVYEIPLAADDPKRQELHMTDMLVPKSAADPTRKASEANTPDTYLNEVTHWWDGSQIYGSSEAKAKQLRSGKDGKMKLNEKGQLPVGKDGVEETGFNRNWTLGLATMHTMFVKEHNAIADMLKESYPDWNDDQLFHKARLINSALMAKIHTTEWTPNVLPQRHLNDAMLANWYGAATKAIHDEGKRESVAWLNVADEAVGGLVGNKIEKHGVPAWLSEEFVSDYAILHSMLPDTLKMGRIGEENKDELPLNAIRQKKSSDVMDEYGLANVFHSFGTQHPGQLVLGNYPETLQNLSVPGFGFFDMAAVDVLRDRERGVPRYNEMRRELGLNPIKKFEDLTDDPEVLEDLKKIYNYDVEQIDFKIGSLAEATRPENFGFGETMFTIFILHASRRLSADRFYTDSYNEETYTPEGLEWIDKNGSKSVAFRHMPELKKTGLANDNVTTVFEPFDTDPEQLNDPSRHPLAFLKR